MTQKNKNIKRILTILALSAVCLTSNAQIVWKISGNGIKKASYIVGTHHSCPDEYCDSIPGLMKAFKKVDNVIGEFNMIKMKQMTPQEMQQMQSMMMMPADTSFASLFTEDEKARLDDYLKANLGVPSDMLASLKPMAIMITLMNRKILEIMPDANKKTGMDQHLQNLAKAEGKGIDGLESMNYQMELLFSGSLEDQADALLEYMDTNNTKELLMQLTDAYKSQDLDRLWEVFQEQMTDYEYDTMVKVRNLNWESRMKELLPKQSTLFVVGAGHLPGEYGMINLLRKAGYKVTPVKK